MTVAHAFRKIRAKVNIRRLRRRVASEKMLELLQSAHTVYQNVSPAPGIPGGPIPPNDATSQRS